MAISTRDPSSIKVAMFDSPSIDAFARLRVSQPHSLFDAQLTYDLQPLLYERLINGSGATIIHDPTNRNALMSFASSPPGSSAIMETFEHFRYQPSKSQLFLTTFNFKEAAAGVTKFVGYSDGINGVEFQLVGSQPRWALLSGTAEGNHYVNQADWSLDKLDGTGPSGVILDFTKTQLCVIDIQALYTGRVRVGFDVGGTIHYVHEFMHANLANFPYLQTCNLPIRCGMTNISTATTSMALICGSVTSEGGVEDVTGFQFSAEGVVTVPKDGTPTHALTIRPKSFFNGIINRTKFVLEAVDVFAGADAVRWQVAVGQALTGASFSDVNVNSSTEKSTAGILSGSPTVVALAGYVPAEDAIKAAQNNQLVFRYPICLGAAGNQRQDAQISIILTNIGGFVAANCRVMLSWKEIR